MLKVKINSKFSKILIVLLLTFFVVGKTAIAVHAFSHQQISISEKENKDCFLCDFANLQKHYFVNFFSDFALIIFAMFFALRKFDRVKLSYLLCCYSSRAPPVIS